MEHTNYSVCQIVFSNDWAMHISQPWSLLQSKILHLACHQHFNQCFVIIMWNSWGRIIFPTIHIKISSSGRLTLQSLPSLTFKFIATQDSLSDYIILQPAVASSFSTVDMCVTNNMGFAGFGVVLAMLSLNDNSTNSKRWDSNDKYSTKCCHVIYICI